MDTSKYNKDLSTITIYSRAFQTKIQKPFSIEEFNLALVVGGGLHLRPRHGEIVIIGDHSVWKSQQMLKIIHEEVMIGEEGFTQRSRTA